VFSTQKWLVHSDVFFTRRVSDIRQHVFQKLLLYLHNQPPHTSEPLSSVKITFIHIQPLLKYMAYAHTACYHYIYRSTNCSGSSYTLSSTSLIKNSCTHGNLTNRPLPFVSHSGRVSVMYACLQLYANTNILMPHPSPVRVAIANTVRHDLFPRDVYT